MARPKGTKTKSPSEAAAAKPGSAKLAIAAFCYKCMGGGAAQKSHAIKAAVRDCPTTDCPLWKWRGYRSVTTKTKQHEFTPKDKPV